MSDAGVKPPEMVLSRKLEATEAHVVEEDVMRALCVVALVAIVFGTAQGAAVGLTEASAMPDPESRDIPQTIWFQGFVEDSGSGEPVDATYDIVVEIFDADVDGTSLWGPEPHATTIILDGWFNVELGLTVDLPTFGSPPYYLELVINGETLSPRQKLGSVPACFRSARTDDVDDDWFYSGANIYRVSGFTGIGTTTPERDLDVAGTVRMDEFEMVPGAASGHVLTSDGSGAGTWQSVPGGGGLDLPYAGSVSYGASAFSVDNANAAAAAAAVSGKHTLSGNYGRLGTGFAGVKGVGGTGRAGDFDGVVYVSERLGIGIDPSEARLGVLTGQGYPAAVYAMHSSTSGATRGVLAYVDSPDGAAIYGESTADSAGIGVHGVATAPHSTGVLGEGPYHAVKGVNTTSGAQGILGVGSVGVYGYADEGGYAGQFSGRVYVSERLGVGTIHPQNALHLRNDNGGDSGIWIENHDTTAQSMEGIFIGDENGMNVAIAAYDDDHASKPSALSLWNTRTGGIIQFETGGSERMRIENDGSVGIGTTAPEAPLHVVGLGGTAIYASVDILDDNSHYAVYGETESLDGWGVYGQSRAIGVGGKNTDTNASGRLGYGSVGVWGYDGNVSSNWAGYFNGSVYVEDDLGVGTSTPYSKLDVDGVVRVRNSIWPATGTGASMELAYSSASHRGYIQVYDRASGGAEWGQLYLGGGSVGIGISTDYSHLLDVAGEIQCTELFETSDGRFKTDVRELANALDAVERLRGVSFMWNELSASAGATPGVRGIGVIAQEVEEVFPELVSSPEGSHKAVDYSKLTAVLIQAVKELRAENEALSARLATLEASER